jgi:hypothetical protein
MVDGSGAAIASPDTKSLKQFNSVVPGHPLEIVSSAVIVSGDFGTLSLKNRRIWSEFIGFPTLNTVPTKN